MVIKLRGYISLIVLIFSMFIGRAQTMVISTTNSTILEYHTDSIKSLNYRNDSLVINFLVGLPVVLGLKTIIKIDFKKIQPTTIIESNNNNYFSLYPNPTQKMVYIDYGSISEEFVKLQLYTTDGIIVKEIRVQCVKGINHLTISLEDFPLGNYFFRIVSSSCVTTKKFILY